MFQTNKILDACLALILSGALTAAYASPSDIEHTTLETASAEAFRDLDEALEGMGIDPNSRSMAPSESRAESDTDSDDTVNVDTVTRTVTSTQGDSPPTSLRRDVEEPSQRELYERLLREEAESKTTAPPPNNSWRETTNDETSEAGAPQATVIFVNDGWMHPHRRGLWHFWHRLFWGPHYHERVRDRRQRRRRAQARERRAHQRAVADRHAQRRSQERAEAERRSRKQARKAKLRQKRERARRAKSKRRAANRMRYKKQRRQHRAGHNARRHRSR